jgi:CDGSH-type Zn-finger protein
MNNETKNLNSADVKVQVLKKGPYLVNGTFLFVDDQGNESVKEGNMALCSCGSSANKPFCDGSHNKSNAID